MLGRKKHQEAHTEEAASDEEDFESMETLRPRERHNFCLLGVHPEQVIELGTLFAEGDRDRLSKELREEAGLPWARNFEDLWETGEEEARRRGLFDLMWHRRALAIDPVANAPDFTGFDVLMTVARQATPELATLLAFVDGNDATNPRRTEGPEWWTIWHKASGSRPGGWLSEEETAAINDQWRDLATAEIEEACLTIMGTPFTHPGCWGLMEDFGGFFAQCSAERRSAVAEVDL